MVDPPIVNGIKAAIAAGLLMAAAGQFARYHSEQQQAAIRPDIKAGSWYEKDPAPLAAQLHSLFQASGDGINSQHAAALASQNAEPGEALAALVCPHAAYRYSGVAAAHAYQLARKQEFKRVFVLGPLHHERLHGIIVPDYQRFATPSGDLALDTATLDQLAACRLFQKNNHAQATEYSIEMQLPFIKQSCSSDVKIVPLCVGKLNDQAEIEYVAGILKRFIGPGDLLVVSSDFTHYGAQYNYVPFTTDVQKNIRNLDATAYDTLRRRDLSAFLKYKSETHNTICGFYPLCVLMAMLPKDCHATLLDYYTSQDVPAANGAPAASDADKSWSVSYLAVAFTGDKGNSNKGKSK